jgi:hypothetical protein
MARKGREFEELVTSIEKGLAPLGAVVKSPDFIPDRVSGKNREVDASIKYTIGSVPILITIECRDRVAKQDITWLEQIKSKRDSVRANQTIVVSKEGFSKEAKAFAALENIQIRQLSDVTDQDILKALPRVEIRDVVPAKDIQQGLILHPETGDDPGELKKACLQIQEELFKNNAPVTFIPSGEKLNLNDLFHIISSQLVGSSQEWSDAQQMSKQHGDKLICKYDLDRNILSADTSLGKRFISGVRFKGKVEFKTIVMPPLTAKEYTDGNKNVIDRIAITKHEEVGTLTFKIKSKKK